MDVRQRCPRCKDDMQIRYRKSERTGEWEWVWTCPTCRHEMRAPETVIERLDHE